MVGGSMRGRREGSGLILSVAVLAILLVLALSFSRLARLERMAGTSFGEAARARLQAEAGVEFALARISGSVASGDYGGLFEPYALDPAGPHRAADLFGTTVSGIARYPSREAIEAAGIDPATAPLLGGSGDREWQSFAVAIRDAQSLIELNQRAESLPRILENLGRAIDEADPPIMTGEGAMIVSYRDSLPGHRFSSVDDLAGIPGGIVSEWDLSRLRPYVTVDAWIDEKVVRPPLASSRPAPGVEYTSRWRPGRLELEGRAPVNVNTAPKPVLVAVLAGLAGAAERRAGVSSWWNPEPTYVQELSQPIDFDLARKIADRIIATRAMDPGAPGAPSYAGPFRSWSQFDAFCDSMRLDPRFRGLSLVWSWIGSSDSGAQLYSANWSMTGLVYRGVPTLPLGSFDVLAGSRTDGLRIRGNRRVAWRWAWFGMELVYYSGEVSGVALEAEEGTYHLEGSHRLSGYSYRWGRYSRGREITAYTNVDRVRFVPRDPNFVGLTDLQVSVLQANCNPNTRLAKFNPDRSRRPLVDKSDLTTSSTEFCFWPMGALEIASVGYVHSGAGELLARHGVHASVRVQDVWRETTQADFEAGSIREAGSGPRVGGGRTLTSYPQPPIGGLRESCVEDGYLMLSTYESPPVAAPLRMRASYEDGFDADEAGGCAIALPDVAGPYAGDVLDPAVQGLLYPDGVYATDGATPRYQAQGNMAGRVGTIAFWVKPDWAASNANWEIHKFFEATSTLSRWETQSFQVGSWGWGTPMLGFQYEAAHTRFHDNDWNLERVMSLEFPGDEGEWQHVVIAYDLDAEEFEDAIKIVVNGRLEDARTGYYTWQQDRTAFPSEDLTANANRFGIGGRSGALIGGDNAADATIDELTLYEGFQPDEVASRLFSLGRYYSGGDATFTSQPCPSTVGRPGTERRVARIVWTGVVPAGVPGGRIRMRVQTGGSWGSLLDDPDGSRVDLPVSGPVRYQAVFEETAREGVEPLLASPSLDDVTIFFTTPPVVTRWDVNLPVSQILDLVRPPEGSNDPEPPNPVSEIVLPGGPPLALPETPVVPPGAGDSAGGEYPFPGRGGGGWVSPPPPPSGNVAGRGGRGGATPNPAGAVRASGGAAASAAREPRERVRVVIEIVDSRTGEPVPRAIASIEEGRRRVLAGMHANQRGRLVLSFAEGRSFEAEIEKEGYQTARTSFKVEGEEKVVRVELQPEEGQD